MLQLFGNLCDITHTDRGCHIFVSTLKNTAVYFTTCYAAMLSFEFQGFVPLSESFYRVIHCNTGDSTAGQETLNLHYVRLIKWIRWQRVFLYWIALSVCPSKCLIVTVTIKSQTSRRMHEQHSWAEQSVTQKPTFKESFPDICLQPGNVEQSFLMF